MKQALLFFCFLAAGLPNVQAQLFPLKTRTDSVVFRLVAVQNRLALDWQGGSPFPVGKKEFLQIENVSLDDADLVVSFATGKLENGFSTDLQINLRPSDGPVFSPVKEAWQTSPPFGETGQKTLLDATETTLEFGRSYTLFLTRNLLGPVDCTAERPVFSLKKRLPYYSAATTGVAMVGLGQLFNSQKKEAYETYRDYWAAERTATEAAPFFDKAQKKYKIAQILTYGGLAVLLTDAFFFERKRGKIRRAQKIFDRFCLDKKQSIGLVPMIETGGFEGPGIGLGLQVSF